jgi:hypothetical protein
MELKRWLTGWNVHPKHNAKIPTEDPLLKKLWLVLAQVKVRRGLAFGMFLS